MRGVVIGGRYRLDDRIGRGAFGEVYRGFDEQLKRVVAVKVLMNVGDNDRFKTRFTRESEALARLRHPNIVTVFDFGEDHEKPFLVMEYVDGMPLLDLCEELVGDVPRVLRIAMTLCDAMDCAHQAGIVHRDLTLRNVMLDASGNLRLLDFGLAKMLQVELQTNSNSIVGTPSYMSPEQASGRSVDGRTDIFSFGVCLYQLLSGRLPFEAEHPTAVVYLIGNEDPPPLPAHVPVALQDSGPQVPREESGASIPDVCGREDCHG